MGYNECSHISFLKWGVYLFTHMKQHVLHKASQLKHPFSISVPEQKLLILFWHFVISTVINLTTFALFARESGVFESSLRKYFTCELGGHDPANPCVRKTTLSNVLVILSYAFHGSLPLSNLVFVISFQGMKKLCSQARVKITAATNSRSFSLRDGI